MDQVKKLPSKVVKLQFWIIIALAVLRSRRILPGQFEVWQTLRCPKISLDKNFGDIKTVSAAIPTHPNAVSQEKMAEIIQDLSEDVRSAWASQYERQAQFLQWPAAINNPLLISRMLKYYPIEIVDLIQRTSRFAGKQELMSYGIYFDRNDAALGSNHWRRLIGKANATAVGGKGGVLQAWLE
ncbi:MAG: hypothetical protein R3C56_25280 [Pirellulaceae bacterium]